MAKISARPAGAKVKTGARAQIREPREEQAPGEQQDDNEAPESTSVAQDSPLLDLSDAAVKRMIKAAKARGYVTYDELNSVLPSEQVSSEQIEDTMAMLAEMGINVVDTEEEAEEAAPPAEAEAEPNLPVKVERSSEPADRTDDPVRMYLREMGSVELLSREGEIAIAKRIEAGREAMIQGLCESPLTFQAIIIWRDELNEGKILLRDIIDLEATYAGPDAKAAPAQPVAPIDMTKVIKLEPKRPESPRERRQAIQERARRRDDEYRPLRKSRTRTTRRTTSRSRRWKPSSSRRCSKPSTASPRPTSRCASCRTRRWRRRPRCRPARSGATASCAKRSSAT
jgi:hypothetical protein